MTFIARLLLAAIGIGTLAWYGGAGPMTRPLVICAVAVVALLSAIGLNGRARVPELGWIAALFVPAVVLCVLQLAPVGWTHHWLADDLAALGPAASGFAQASIEPAVTTRALAWALTLATVALVGAALWRGERARALADGLVVVGALAALAGLCLALAGEEWPTSGSIGRARGPFVYPNHAAACWAALLPLAALGACRRGQWWRWGALAVLALGVLLSGSRGGILVAALVMLPLTLTLLPQRRRWWWATGIGAGLAGWLWLIGIADVAARFAEFRNEDGITLSGRVTMWRAAWPVALDAGPLGSGAGTVIPAYRRAGDPVFAPLMVDHLHSDPLEWLLEYGWAGALAGAIGLTGALWLVRRARGDDAPDADAAADHRGALLGLLILTLHACGDFILHNQAIAIEAALLAVVAAQRRRSSERTPVGSTIGLRLATGSLGLLLLALLPAVWRHQTDVEQTSAAGKALDGRIPAGLDPHGSAVVQRTLLTPAGPEPAAVQLAVLQSWLAGDDRAIATRALTAAARLAPGDAAAWAERARLAAIAGDLPALRTALSRALAWAPAWPGIHAVALDCVRLRGNDAVGAGVAADLARRLLAMDLPQPRWFFDLAESLLGADAVAGACRQERPQLSAAAAPWLAERGPLTAWLAYCRRPGTREPRVPAWLALSTGAVHGARLRIALPDTADERVALADLLDRVGLPVPAPVSDALRADGRPWSYWALPPQLTDQQTRESLAVLLRNDLHRPWVRAFDDRNVIATRTATVDFSGLDRETDPRLLTWVLAGRATASEHIRLVALLTRYAQLDWQALPSGGRWSWWYANRPGMRAAVAPTRWTGLVIDGKWIGWIRGAQDLAPLMGAGLHRVALLDY